MPTIIDPAPAAIESMVGHSWLGEDQKAAFTAFPFVPALRSVSTYLSPWLVSNGCDATRVSRGICVGDDQITVCLLNQALDFLQRAFCNTVGHYVLAQKGLETWARVTNYYASYFSIHSLLCIQGRTITKLKLDKGLDVQIVPLDFRNHIFGITHRHLGKNPHHEAPWKRFYEIYDRYAVSHSAYEVVARKAYITEPADESIERNKLNYTPFEGFREIRDLTRHQQFSSLFTDYVSNLETKASLEEFLTDLRGYATDADRKYFARTLLRIALAADILSSIGSASIALQTEWVAMHQKWRDFLDAIFPNPSTCYLLRFIPLIGPEVN
jgi:hypothetical protein